ncbi:AraC family transcriptional regulator [Maritimibacter sp. UBA3975]|uniref:AraC family transcriptional regulator n=1 Tax=Maritimibacter sp. UBA3975 TaxID=1946833 RepID=UPI000C0AB93F|nr:AraC family transcriptional regulator [Maritimibacter sp. UBA3975]MAM61947.1 AraC family transcriptional regulator [Maritimibacter sp.]|tara:strand:+ start:19863 stop:20699 length:837 start_codon:yes stop_codon:yes gene_type:complete
MANDYEKRLLRVLDHVYDNLDGDLSLDTLAEVAALSRFHFHRVFTAVTGETLAYFIRRVRLHRAAMELLSGDLPVAEVAAKMGYDNTRSFSRTFRDAFGRTPSEFRSHARTLPPLRLGTSGEKQMYDVKIEDQPERRLAMVEHRGPYIGIGEAFDKAGSTVMARGLGLHLGAMLGLYFDDPDNTPPEALRSAAGFEIDDSAPIEPPLVEMRAPGGKHAILTHKGPYTGLALAYKYLFGEWLATSGEMPREAPPFELYVNSPMDTAPDDLITLIGVPLA